MEHIVTGCKDCPYQYDWQGCYAPSELHKILEGDDEAVIDFINGGSPSWCPLKKELITIKIKE